MQIDKSQLLDEIIRMLEAAYQNAVDAAEQARETATDGENIAENKYDTLGLEAAYLAHGQSQRAADLKAEIKAFKSLPRKQCLPDDAIKVGTGVVLVDESEIKQYLFIGPGGGGLKATHEGKEFLVITASSPLGKALLACYLHDKINLVPDDKTKYFEIINVI